MALCSQMSALNNGKYSVKITDRKDGQNYDH